MIYNPGKTSSNSNSDSSGNYIPSTDNVFDLGSSIRRWRNLFLGGQAFLSRTTNQLVLGLTNTTTISATAPTASRTYTIPDSGANSSFVMSDGNQTINGNKTFTGSTNVNGLTIQTSPMFCTNFASFTNPIQEITTATTITSASTSISAAAILGKIIIIGDGGADFNGVLPNASTIINALPISTRAVGVTISIYIVNPSIRNLLALTPGINITIQGTTGLNSLAPAKLMLLRITNLSPASITLYA